MCAILTILASYLFGCVEQLILEPVVTDPAY